MAPTKSKKRASDATEGTKVPVKSPSTPQHNPIKKRKMGISTHQKQALIDNLQLEVTERARRLRAQYQLQAQGLRSRIEIRINRIPMALRKAKMGDLLLKYIKQEQNKASKNGPPVPAKDTPQQSPLKPSSRQVVPSRTYKRLSTEISGDKENAFETGDGPKKRARPAADAGRVRPNQILSPTSSNSRLTNRDRPTSPSKFQMSRPGSPLKVNGTSRSVAATSVLSSMVERAKATRAKGTRKATTPLEAGRTKRQPATTSRAPPSRPATRAGRRGSATSETSDGSVGTVVRKPSTTRVPTSSRAAAGGVRKATASTAKKAAPKATTAASIPTSASGRVLRKRT